MEAIVDGTQELPFVLFPVAEQLAWFVEVLQVVSQASVVQDPEVREQDLKD